MLYANDGWVRDTTEDALARYTAVGAEYPADQRHFSARCGGCPRREEHDVSVWMLEDAEFADNKWLTYQGWALDPIRCPYCTGKKPRPDDPLAAPYPAQEA